MMEYSTPNGHVVITIAGRNYIIDTGSPLSFNFVGIRTLEIEGRAFSFSSAQLCSKEEADELTGIDIAGLIGTDILKKSGLTIEPETGTLDFSADSAAIDPGAYACLSFDYFMGQCLMTKDIFMGRRLRNAIIDTGAPVPYIAAELASFCEHTGERYEDYNPNFGSLRGEYLRGELTFAHCPQKVSRIINAGVMPERLRRAYGNTDAIFGVAALTDKKIIFDFDQKKIYVKI